MGIAADNAWMLHKRPITDNSYYVTFFTEEKGLIVALYRSSKKQGILQQFTPFWVDFTEKLNKFYVNKIEQKSASLNFTKHSLFAGLYINELLYYLLKPEDENNFLFTHYERTLKRLETSSAQNSVEIILRSFEFKLLEAIGYGVNLSIDIEENSQVNKDKYYNFIPDKGIVSAQQGILGKYLLAIDKYDFRDEIVLKIAKKITRSALDYFLGGKKLNSRDLYIKT